MSIAQYKQIHFSIEFRSTLQKNKQKKTILQKSLNGFRHVMEICKFGRLPLGIFWLVSWESMKEVFLSWLKISSRVKLDKPSETIRYDTFHLATVTDHQKNNKIH